MLRSLNKPIELGNAKCEIVGDVLNIVGKHGSISMKCLNFLELEISGKEMVIKPRKALSNKTERAMAGTFKANLLLNLKGVNDLHDKFVIFTGTGCSVKEGTIVEDGASVSGLQMRLGKSHIVEKRIPDGVTCKVESSDIRETKLRVSGIDLSLVGRFASELRVKNAYKGGIHAWVEGKEIPLKEGKSG